jgi:hypothetical protein
MMVRQPPRRTAAKRECPYCKEAIKPDAVKCKHCLSYLGPETLPHGGTCPYCKETIKPDAIKCRHCRSQLLSGPESVEMQQAFLQGQLAERFLAGTGVTGLADLVGPVVIMRSNISAACSVLCVVPPAGWGYRTD